MLKISDGDEEEVDNEIRYAIEAEHRGERALVDERREQRERDNQTDVRHDDVMSILWLEERRRWLKVIRASAVVLTGDVDEQIGRPAEQQRHRNLVEIHERRVEHRLAHLRTRARNEHLIAILVIGVLVMRAVRDAPAVVRHEQRRVQHETDRIVEPLVVRERLMTALVRQHPNTSQNNTLICMNNK